MKITLRLVDKRMLMKVVVRIMRTRANGTWHNLRIISRSVVLAMRA